MFGPLLGAFDGVEWSDVVLDLGPENKLVIYTDGVTDALGNNGERYGAKRLQAVLDRCRDLSAPEIIRTLTHALQQFQVGDSADDVAAVVLRRVSSAAHHSPALEPGAADPTDTIAA